MGLRPMQRQWNDTELVDSVHVTDLGYVRIELPRHALELIRDGVDLLDVPDDDRNRDIRRVTGLSQQTRARLIVEYCEHALHVLDQVEERFHEGDWVAGWTI